MRRSPANHGAARLHAAMALFCSLLAGACQGQASVGPPESEGSSKADAEGRECVHSGDLEGDATPSSPSPSPEPRGDASVAASAPGEGCGSPPTCAEGQVCDAVSRTCITPRAEDCGFPPDEGGSQVEFGKAYPWELLCDPADPAANRSCGPGLTCVEDYMIPYYTTPGACLRSCDPCDPTCAPGHACVRLGDGRGVCTKKLCRLGEHCTDEPNADVVVCEGGTLTQFGDCVSGDRLYCTPDTLRCPSYEDSCGPGMLCRGFRQDAEGNHGLCTYIPEGDERRQTGELGQDCEDCNSTAILRRSMAAETYSICSHRCSPDSPCPDGVGCYTLGVRQLSPGVELTEVPVCIRDGAMPAGYPCASDENCGGGLRCVPDDQVASHVCAP